MIFTSDLHFNHKNVIKYCNRPWTFEEQTDELITRWNSKVTPQDDVYSLGDFMFSSKIVDVMAVIKRLNGRKHFILGNHCPSKVWNKVKELDSSIVWVKDYAELNIDGKFVVLSHYPMQVWNKNHYGSFHLHGHCHGSLPSEGKRLDVGIDNHPTHQLYSWDEIKEYMNNQQINVADHHTGER